MKIRRLALILALMMQLSVFLTGCEPGRPVGEWIAVDARDAIVFYDNGTFETLRYARDRSPSAYPPGMEPGGYEPSEIPGTGKWRPDLQGKYAVDFSKNPAWIDLVVVKNGSLIRREGLMLFLDDDTFYMLLAEARPASIDTQSRARFTRAAPNELNR